MMSKQPDTLLSLRGFGIELGVFLTILLQFWKKISYIFTYQIGASTSILSSSSSSANSKKSRSYNYFIFRKAKQLTKRGRFFLIPNVFEVSNIGLCSISMPNLFYDTDRNSMRDSLNKTKSISNSK